MKRRPFIIGYKARDITSANYFDKNYTYKPITGPQAEIRLFLVVSTVIHRFLQNILITVM